MINHSQNALCLLNINPEDNRRVSAQKLAFMLIWSTWSNSRGKLRASKLNPAVLLHKITLEDSHLHAVLMTYENTGLTFVLRSSSSSMRAMTPPSARKTGFLSASSATRLVSTWQASTTGVSRAETLPAAACRLEAMRMLPTNRRTCHHRAGIQSGRDHSGFEST